MASWDLIVVGGGIVGASAAYHGARAGGRVLLIDRDDRGRATAAGAGIVAPETDVHHSTAYFELARIAAAYYPKLLDGLTRRAGYQRCGMLVVAADDLEARAFDAFAAQALERQRARGDVPPADALRVIDAGEARDRFPALRAVERALWNPRGARVDGREVTAALLETALARGATRVAGSVESIAADRGNGAAVVVGAASAGDEHHARAVVVAGGAWSPRLAAAIDVRVPVEPQRGQIVHLVLEGVDTALWPMVSGFRDHYLVAWPGGRVAAGATRETGSGFDVRTTAAGVREVLTEALRLAPGLEAATLAEVRVGLRPLSSDGLPVLGPIPDRRGLWLATGHGPAGLMLGPYSGKVVAEAALGGRWPAELDAFSVARFGPVSARFQGHSPPDS